MSGLIATVLLRSPFLPADTGQVTSLLREHSDEVIETRKGRYWEFLANDLLASLTVLRTDEHDYDFEADLLSNDLLFDDAPEAFVLNFGASRDCDRAVCELLAQRLAKQFGGIDCGLRQ